MDNNITPYVRIASIFMHSRIGCTDTCMLMPYRLHCDFPSASIVCDFAWKLIVTLNISKADAPIFISCTTQLWMRMLKHKQLHFSCWPVTLSVIMNTVGKVLDDSWWADSNGILCATFKFDLNVFNLTESAVWAALDYNISLFREEILIFLNTVKTMHTSALEYIAADYKNIFGCLLT